MNLFTLECPHCKAALDVEDGLDTFYCKYCGSKLIVEGMSGDSLDARVRLREMGTRSGFRTPSTSTSASRCCIRQRKKEAILDSHS